MTLAVSDPQRLAMPDNYIHGHVNWLRSKGVDVHEFCTEYVNRTAELGYAPDLQMSVEDFINRRREH